MFKYLNFIIRSRKRKEEYETGICAFVQIPAYAENLIEAKLCGVCHATFAKIQSVCKHYVTGFIIEKAFMHFIYIYNNSNLQ